jgi:hypothetical protein
LRLRFPSAFRSSGIGHLSAFFTGKLSPEPVEWRPATIEGGDGEDETFFTEPLDEAAGK